MDEIVRPILRWIVENLNYLAGVALLGSLASLVFSVVQVRRKQNEKQLKSAVSEQPIQGSNKTSTPVIAIEQIPVEVTAGASIQQIPVEAMAATPSFTQQGTIVDYATAVALSGINVMNSRPQALLASVAVEKKAAEVKNENEGKKEEKKKLAPSVEELLSPSGQGSWGVGVNNEALCGSAR